MVSITTTDIQQALKAQLFMKMDVPLYKRSNGCSFEKINKYLKRNESYIAIDIQEDYIQLSDGTFIKDINNEHYDLTYGDIEVLERTPVCSRGGVVLRYVVKGQHLKIKNINDNHFEVGKNEYISFSDSISVSYL